MRASRTSSGIVCSRSTRWANASAPTACTAPCIPSGSEELALEEPGCSARSSSNRLKAWSSCVRLIPELVFTKAVRTFRLSMASMRDRARLFGRSLVARVREETGSSPVNSIAVASL